MKNFSLYVWMCAACGSWLGCADESTPRSVEDEHGHDHAATADEPLGEDFHALLRFTRAYPVPRTLRATIDDSEVIAAGHFSDAVEGRTIDYREGASNPIRTVVFEIAVDEIIKGPALGSLFVEFPRAIVAPAMKFKEHLPTVECIFIVQAPTWDEKVYSFQNDRAGVPEGSSLFAFSYPFGIIAQAEGSLAYPLLHDPDELPAEVFQAKSLDELRPEIAALQ